MSIIDTHLHLHSFSKQNIPAVINNIFLEKAILVSATKDDFVAIENLISTHHNKFIGAFGYHPWQAKTDYDLDYLCTYLENHPQALVGEIGVDRLKAPVDDAQHNLFKQQLDIAIKYNRPVIIHAAKAFMDLQKHKEDLQKIKFSYHGFTSNFELIKFINKCDGYIGLGSHFLQQKKAKEMFEMMNINRVLFETDAPYMVDENNYNQIVEENLKKLAIIANINYDDLCNKLTLNAKEFIKC